MRVSHRPTLNSNYKEFCRVNFELLRVLYRPNLNLFTSFRIIESSAEKTSNYCVFKISLSSVSISKHLEDSIKQCRVSSKIIVCTLPHRQDLPSDSHIHHTIELFYNFIEELCNSYKGVQVPDINSVGRSFFTCHGMHLRMGRNGLLALRIIKALCEDQIKQAIDTLDRIIIQGRPAYLSLHRGNKPRSQYQAFTNSRNKLPNVLHLSGNHNNSVDNGPDVVIASPEPLYLGYDSDIIPATPEPCSHVIVPTSRIPQQTHVPSELYDVAHHCCSCSR
ncbi:hypothetical protein J6590_071832 [Homalodisca vitripennis]|nr:hypothetical protein J6590_071832 [Homalodisca vitripennis]